MQYALWGVFFGPEPKHNSSDLIILVSYAYKFIDINLDEFLLFVKIKN